MLPTIEIPIEKLLWDCTLQSYDTITKSLKENGVLNNPKIIVTKIDDRFLVVTSRRLSKAMADYGIKSVSAVVVPNDMIDEYRFQMTTKIRK